MTVLKRRDTFTLLLPAAVKRGLAVVLVGGLLAACTVTETRRGHLLPEGVAAELSAANMSQQRVVELLGTPSTVSAFDRNRWYYIGEVQQHQAFFKPDVVARDVLILDFDNNQQLAKVGTLSEKDGQEVTLVSRETPTEGNKITVLEQILGNLGRFNNKS
jgi:outer membrane protein assembly factor BamE (lipoprotein component of BamABCDE complex)